jgi:hypothetical protein
MDSKIAQKLVKICHKYIDDIGYDDSDLKKIRCYHNYSGRWMYGRKTSGVVVPSATFLMEAILFFPKELLDSGGEPIYRDSEEYELRMDQLGEDFIIY